jgi:hypothetical protein
MDGDAIGMPSVIGPTVIELFGVRVNAHLRITY